MWDFSGLYWYLAIVLGLVFVGVMGLGLFIGAVFL